MCERELIAREILRQVTDRGIGKTICPSEVARALWPGGWRDRMPAVRAVAADLATDARIRVSQRGQTVDALSARGPIRLGLADPS